MSGRLAWLMILLLTMSAGAHPPVRVTVDGRDAGRRFDGIGGVSAGASSRLLIDYPEPYRKQVLDYLFKPMFGACFQHLKVEMAGGENATSGSEPSHAVDRAELVHPHRRGYEFWLMREARNRNPHILLDCLPWCYPGFLAGRFTQDAADWFVAFLDAAREQHTRVDWMSAAQNETGTDRDWIVKVLRPTLDAHGYGAVKLQAPDNDKEHWQFFASFRRDAAFRRAVDAVGYHYICGREPWDIDEPGHPTTAQARADGKPLWASEEWSNSGREWDGTGALYVAREMNKLYIRDRITKTELWSLVAAIPKGLPWSGTGPLRADSPWCGHYEVWPAVWAIAHTTQFAQPGWHYVDPACGQFDTKTWRGTYVTLRSGHDWSMVVCSGDALRLTVRVVGGLKTGPIHVWRSNARQQFVQGPDAGVDHGEFTVPLEKDAILTLTTTSGQQKGHYPPSPADAAFPLPYHDEFESYAAGDTPHYFTDQKGSFEVADRPDHGHCLKQIAPRQGIMWGYMTSVLKPYTVIGDDAWTDYSISADVFICGGNVEIGGRYTDQNKLNYRLILSRDGTWKLNYQASVLAGGRLPSFDASQWHALKLTFRGQQIEGSIDGHVLASIVDYSSAHGMAWLGSTYDPNLFDNVDLAPLK